MTAAAPESRWTPATARCPHPGRWHSTDSDSTEIEVTDLVAGFVRALQPTLVVETGSAFGQTSEAIGRALARNGQGLLVTFEPDPQRARYTRERCGGLPVEVRGCSSLDPDRGIEALRGPVEFAWLDSLFDLRFTELDLLRPRLAPAAVVGLHDTAPHHPLHRHLATRVGDVRLDLPTPRGVTFLQVTR